MIFNGMTGEVLHKKPLITKVRLGYKICFTCKEEKREDEFYSNKAKSSGRYGSCIPCFKAKLKYPKTADFEILYKREFLEIEEWKPVVIADLKYPYLISDSGRIRILKSGKIASPSLDQRGYPQIVLTRQGVRVGRRIHILVAEMFLDNPDNLPEVNHLDGNKLFPHKSNLVYSTSKDNVDHATANGLRKAFTSDNHPHNIPVFNVETKMVYVSIKEAEIQNGIKRGTLSRKFSGKSKNDTKFVLLR